MANDLKFLIENINVMLDDYSVSNLTEQDDYKVVFDLEEQIKEKYYLEVSSGNITALKILQTLVFIKDYKILRFNLDEHLENISKDNYLALFINKFPQHSASSEYFKKISSWFIENVDILDSLLSRSGQIKNNLHQSDERNINESLKEEISYIIRIKNKLSVLKKVEDKIDLFDSRNSINLTKWLQALPYLI